MIFIFEKLEISKKEVNVILGISIVACGLLFDYFL